MSGSSSPRLLKRSAHPELVEGCAPTSRQGAHPNPQTNSTASAVASLATSPSASPLLSAPPVREALSDFVDLTRGFFASVAPLPSASAASAAPADASAAILAPLRALPPGAGGTVEFALCWPCEETNANDGSLIALESVVLQVQVAARRAGWPCRLLGQWPAKAYLVVQVPPASAAAPAGGAVAFVQTELAAALSAVGLDEWWRSSSGGADLMPVKVESSATWDRRASLAYDCSLGAVRVYPADEASYEDVVAALVKMLAPAATSKLPAAR